METPSSEPGEPVVKISEILKLIDNFISDRKDRASDISQKNLEILESQLLISKEEAENLLVSSNNDVSKALSAYYRELMLEPAPYNKIA